MSLPEPHRHGIVLDHTLGQIAKARYWAYRITGLGDSVNSKVATIAALLAENAHKHTRSGLPGGFTEIIIARGPFLVAVEVTDQGPRPGVARYPLPETRSDKAGLRLVERLAVYWDWSGDAGYPLTVRAMVERP
jgi:anti-sigma regulatory factor (Ser/Thr protein kinase)